MYYLHTEELAVPRELNRGPGVRTYYLVGKRGTVHHLSKNTKSKLIAEGK